MSDLEISFIGYDGKVINHFINLLKEKAPIDKEDEKVTPQEVRDYFIKSTNDIDINENGAFDLKDNLPLLMRLKEAKIQVKTNDEKVKERITERISSVKNELAKILNEITIKSDFPHLEGRLIKKDEARKMISYLLSNAEVELTKEPRNENKQRICKYLRAYLESFDKTSEEDLWCISEKSATCAAVCRIENGKLTAFPALNRKDFTIIWNNFNNPDVQKLCMAFVYKETEHLLTVPTRFSKAGEIIRDFQTRFERAKNEDGKIEITEDLYESAKWLIAMQSHEEKFGYDSMIRMLKSEGYDSGKLSKVSDEFFAIPCIFFQSKAIEKYMKECSGSDGNLDPKKFGERFFEGKQDGLLGEALAIIQVVHGHLVEKEKVDKSESPLSFLGDPTYFDINKFPLKLMKL